MKSLHLFLLLLVLFCTSCFVPKKANLSSSAKFEVLDSLKFVRFPDENYLPKGNKVFQEIIAHGESIKLDLIEKIIDTTTSNMRIADSYNYKNGDIAVLLLPYVVKEKISLRNLIFEEFKTELQYKQSDFFESIYYDVFFSNTKKGNYKNRVRFYKAIKRVYGSE